MRAHSSRRLARGRPRARSQARQVQRLIDANTTSVSTRPANLYDVQVDVPSALPQRPAFDTPVQRLIDANAASVSPSRPAALYDVQVDVPSGLPQRPAFDTPIQRLIDANAASVGDRPFPQRES